MARLRKFVCYRRLERPYTRFSKFKKLSYVRARPHCRISKFTAGVQREYDATLHLVVKDSLQVRDNALESARQATVRVLEKKLGKTGYFFQARIYPHHVLRENPLASGAGADRLSTGMKHSFGKPIGIAAQVSKGQPVFTIFIDKPNVQLARQALKAASYKLPCSCSIIVEEKNK